MKVRLGFVSNSSSASFLIASKKEITYSLIKKNLIDYFKKDRGYPMYITKIAIDIFSKIFWEAVSETTDPDLNPISYREKEYDPENNNKKYILNLPFYKELSSKGYNYFYKGEGVSDEIRWLFGIRIENKDFALHVANSY